MKSIIAYLLAFTMMVTVASQAFLPAVAAMDAESSVSVVQVQPGSEEETGEPASQQPDDFYVSRSQYVIENNGSADEIRLKTIELLERLKGDLRKEDARSEENHQGSTGAF